MSAILLQEIEFTKEEVLQGLQQYGKETYFQIQDIIYYPYYFFEYQVSAKSLLKFNGKAACTIDGLGGRGAMVDVRPSFSRKKVEVGRFPELVIGEEEAIVMAERFIFDNASSKAKFITMPKITEVQRNLFYRPFWITDFKLDNKKSGQLIVDAISGSYHPL
ncbi:hypothetical protein CSV71_02845 [Sporosarcina sp. P21c]|uniref:hypothetical protein n=1 Tax=Sporosarcina sp. P21c TaxID=2048255 RepID=UPI000C16F3BE|nr:hypothetical protein [Sporosarcina sp. P21c]PIC91008.1 hypothetical protein CSV71_02845 [Sporosarcina sp. P21c]